MTTPHSVAEQLRAMTGKPMLNLLCTHQFAELDRVLGLAQQRFEAGESDEAELQRLLKSFEQVDVRLGEDFGAWFEAAPPQYGMLLALSRWLLAMGWHARGGRTSNYVTDRGWRNLGSALEEAGNYSAAAARLSSHPLHAYLIQSGIANTIGNRLTLEDLRQQHYPEWYVRGLQAYPQSFMMRENMLYALRTEWGGSEEMMLEYVRQQEKGGFPDTQKLWATYHALAAHYQAHFAHDAQAALERAKMAAQLNPQDYRPLLFQMLDAANAPQAEQEQVIREIVRDLRPQQLLGINFYLSFTHAQHWWQPYVSAMGNHMLSCAQNGDEESLYMLGYYNLCRSQFNWPDPTQLLREARERGDEKAADLLVDLKRKALKDANDNSPRALAKLRQDIVKAADLGNADSCWEIVDDYAIYQQQFVWEGENEPKRLEYLLVAADGGHAMAQQLTARLLVDNDVLLTEDGKLELVYGEEVALPTQRSLDYGLHLLERGAASGYKPAQELLESLPSWRWDAQEIQRIYERKEKREKYGRNAASTTAPQPAPSPTPATPKPEAKGGLAKLWGNLTSKK